MRHVFVRRIFFALAVLFVLCAVAFALLVTREPGDPPPPATEAGQHAGADLFASYCGSCHTAESLRPGVVDATVEQRREILRFLEDHGRASDEQDRLIVEYLAGETEDG